MSVAGGATRKPKAEATPAPEAPKAEEPAAAPAPETPKAEEPAAAPEEPLEPIADQRLIRRVVTNREHAQRNLRSIAEERVADRAMPRPDNGHDLASVRLHVNDIRAVNPRMATTHALFAARRDHHDRRHAH